MWKVVAVGLALLAVTACSKAEQDADAGPQISASTGTSVRFSYRYTVALPDKRIAGVQEEHVQACERLGLARCRIMGLRYRLVAEDEVQATLALRLDPAIARQFGKAGLDAVRRAGGAVIDTSIDGDAISGGMSASVAKSGPLDPSLVALTPVEFDYQGGVALARFGSGRISAALSSSLAAFMTMASFVLIAIGAAAPWALLGVGLVAAWRSRPMRQLRHILTSDPATL